MVGGMMNALLAIIALATAIVSIAIVFELRRIDAELDKLHQQLDYILKIIYKDVRR